MTFQILFELLKFFWDSYKNEKRCEYAKIKRYVIDRIRLSFSSSESRVQYEFQIVGIISIYLKACAEPWSEMTFSYRLYIIVQ